MELRGSKTVGMGAQGACRSLIIYRCELGDQGVYVCDARDAQSSASLKVQGEGWVGGCKNPLAPHCITQQVLGPLALLLPHPSCTPSASWGGGVAVR